MKVETVYGEELVLEDGTENEDDVKRAIEKKYGYPVERQYLHRNRGKWIMGQFGSRDCAKTRRCPFSAEFLELGCPESLVEALYGEGYGKEQLYERLLPGLRKEEDTEESLDQTVPCVEGVVEILKRDVFSAEDLIQAYQDPASVLGNEDEYCERVLRHLFGAPGP